MNSKIKNVSDEGIARWSARWMEYLHTHQEFF